MAHKLSLVISILLLCFSFNSHAVEKFSCADLEDSIIDLNDIADGFHAAGVIKEGDATDVALRDVVDSLHIFAAVEKEGDLSYHVNNLDHAWEDMDSDHFADALEGVIDSLDRLLRRDCY